MAIYRRIAVLSLCAIFLFAAVPLFSQSSSEKTGVNGPSDAAVLSSTGGRDVVLQARKSYYSLKTDGLGELRCEVSPDWDSIYKQLNADAIGQTELLPILKKIHFRVVVGPDGASTVSHESDVPPPTEQLAERIRRSISGMEQIVTGFLHTWSGFAFSSPIPNADADYRVENLGTKYRVIYREGQADVRTVMTHDFAVEDLSVTAPEFSGSVRPMLSNSKNGFMLVGYDASYKSTAATSAQQLSVKIGYREVEGFQVPATVDAITPLPSGTLTTPLRFDCQVKRQ